MKKTYSFWIGLKKTFKNLLIVFAPAMVASSVAFQANAPVEYQGLAALLASAVTYMVKNYIENK